MRALLWSLATLLATLACGPSPENTPIVVVPVATASEPPGVAATAAPSASSAPSKKPPSRADRRTDAEARDLDASIAVAIAMLEAEEYRAFLFEFVGPTDVAHFEKDGGLEGIVETFAAEKAKPLLRILRAARSMTPVRTGNLAKFDLPNEMGLTWINEDGRWYVKN